MRVVLRRMPGVAAGRHARIKLLGPMPLAIGHRAVPAVVGVIVGCLILRPDRLSDEFHQSELRVHFNAACVQTRQASLGSGPVDS
jgi:hypothetical protein